MAMCWGGSAGTSGAKNLGKLVMKASSVVGMELDSVEDEREAKSYHG